MDSLMSLDDSNYAAEVQRLNAQEFACPSLPQQHEQEERPLAKEEGRGVDPYADDSGMQVDGPSHLQDKKKASPSPLGKRSYSDYTRDSDAEIAIGSSTPKIDKIFSPPARSSPHKQSGRKIFSPKRRLHQAKRAKIQYQVLPIVSTGVRRIGGGIATILEKAGGLFSAWWKRWRVATEIVAVETDESGRKRRAVAQKPATSPMCVPVQTQPQQPQQPPAVTMEKTEKKCHISGKDRLARIEKFRLEKLNKQQSVTTTKKEAPMAPLKPGQGPSHMRELRRLVEARDRAMGIYREPVPASSKEKDALVETLIERAKKVTLTPQPQVEESPEPEPEPQKKVIDILEPISQEWAEKLDAAMLTKNPKTSLATTAEGVDLTLKDFATVLAAPGQQKASNWLNDEMVNGFFAAIVSRKKEQAGHSKGNPAPYATFPSGWYNNAAKKGLHSIKRWTRPRGIQKANLLQAEKVFLPVNTGAHWMLCVVSPKDKTIEVLDSLQGKNSRLYSLLRDWLKQELEELYEADEWTELTNKSSMQDNSDDCGVFTCFNGLAAAEGVPYTQVTAEKMQDARRRMGAILLNGGFHGDFML